MPDFSRKQAIIIGSERGVRRLDPNQSYPHALSEVGGPDSSDHRKSVLEWTLAGLAAAGVRDGVFVGGYHIQKVVARFPHLRFGFHEAWEREGAVGALLVGLNAAAPGADLVIVTGDIALRSSALDAPWPAGAIGFGLARAKADEPGVWSIRQKRLVKGSTHRASGVMIVPSSMVQMLAGVAARVLSHDPGAEWNEVPSALMHAGVTVRGVDMTGSTASVQRPRDLAAFVLGTKAQTLERLAPLVAGVNIPKVHRFTVKQWSEDPARVLAQVEQSLQSTRLVVRSSSLLEDLFETSNAGAFYSELDVARADLPGAIERVIDSYATRGGHRSDVQLDGDEVLVQPYVSDAVCNGVLFTRVPDDAAPYAVLNYERADGRTDGITSGKSFAAKVMICSRSAGLPDDGHWTTRVFGLGRRLEELIRQDGLDIEFAVDTHDNLHLLQVRPLATDSIRRRAYGDDDVSFELEQIRTTIAEVNGESPQLLGRRGALGIMPDWNPAEIIGVCPRPLALSLYRRVVTDDVWAQARHQLGYRLVSHVPLMHALGGRPYIDVRASLNSLLPRQLDDAIGARLIDAAIERLRTCPQLHDKIEFELMPTCGDANPERWRARLHDEGFTARECEHVIAATTHHTDQLLKQGTRDIDRMINQTRSLAESRTTASRIADCGSVRSHLAAARLLMDAAVESGTRPFAALARCAFIAISLLQSLRQTGVLDDAEHAAVLAGMPSVAGEVARHLRDVRAGRLSRSEFLSRHGHLRPGTYDILTPSYAEAPDQYLGAEASSAAKSDVCGAPDDTAQIVLTSNAPAIERALRTHGYSVSSKDVIDFVCAAIPAREQAKHEFTKNISLALSHFVHAGAGMGLSRDAISCIPVDRLLRLAHETPSAAERTELERTVGVMRKRHDLTMALRLPHLLFEPQDAMCFSVSSQHPNFVTRKRASGPGRLLRVGPAPTTADLSGAIVLIENADPGYDWVFSHRIAGLVTKYGGVASHMAIRAAEFHVPAAIGCGDTIFDPLVSARTIEIDCAAERVRGAA